MNGKVTFNNKDYEWQTKLNCYNNVVVDIRKINTIKDIVIKIIKNQYFIKKEYLGSVMVFNCDRYDGFLDKIDIVKYFENNYTEKQINEIVINRIKEIEKENEEEKIIDEFNGLK